MESFEKRLDKLEKLNTSIKKSDLPIEEALKLFEEGIKLSKSMEKDLDKIESRIQILMNQSTSPDEKPELDLFSSVDMN